jgi:hypothetical protein
LRRSECGRRSDASVGALVFAAGIDEYPRGAPPHPMRLRPFASTNENPMIAEQTPARTGDRSEMTRDDSRRRIAGQPFSVRTAA